MTNELIERLSAATDNRDGNLTILNNEIALLKGWHRYTPSQLKSKRGGWIAPEDWICDEQDGSPRLDSMHGTTIHRFPPQWLFSIDAAMKLVAGGFSGGSIEYNNSPVAIIRLRGFNCETTAKASTIPIALCIAALLAKEIDDV